jgi:hypothetical protein
MCSQPMWVSYVYTSMHHSVPVSPSEPKDTNDPLPSESWSQNIKSEVSDRSTHLGLQGDQGTRVWILWEEGKKHVSGGGD